MNYSTILTILGCIVSTENWPPCLLQNHNPLSLVFVAGPNRCSHCPNHCSHWYCSPAKLRRPTLNHWTTSTRQDAQHRGRSFLVITEHKHPTRCTEEAFSWSWKENSAPLLVFLCFYVFVILFIYMYYK